MIYHILLGMNLLTVVTAQLLLKKGMTRYKEFNAKDLPKILTNTTVLLGLTLYGVSLALWMGVLSGLDLSYALPIESLNYFLIAIFSQTIFHEKVSKKRWLSIATIVFGVILVALS